MKVVVERLSQEYCLEVFPRKRTRSEVATCGALNGRESPNSAVIGKRGSSRTGGNEAKLLEVNPRVGPQGPDGVNKVKCW